MSLRENLALIVTADVNGAVRELERVGTTADRDLGRAEQRSEQMSAGFRKAGAIMLTGGALAAAGLYSAARATSDLAEAQNVTAITFGEGAEEIGDAATEAADKVGLSERAYREASAGIGGLLQNLGFAQDETVDWSRDLVTLASDLGSAFNREPAEAVEAIGSALRGETEPIRAFNVMLDDASVRAKAVQMGLADTTAEVDAHGKAQATLALIMAQTSRYQGDFANTSDGAANAQRRFSANLEDFQATLGEGALPVLEDFLSVGNSVLGFYGDMGQGTQSAISTTATWTTGLLLAGGAISTVAGHAVGWRDRLREVTQVSGENVTTTQQLKGGIASAAGVVGAAAAVWGVYSSVMESARKEGEQHAQAARESTLSLGSYDEMVQEVNRDMMLLAENAPDDSLLRRGVNSDTIAAYNALGDGLRDLSADLEAMQPQAQAIADRFGISAGAALDWVAAQAQLGTVFESSDEALRAYESEVETNAGLTHEAAAAAEDWDQALQNLKTAFDDLIGVHISTSEAVIATEEGYAALTQSILENGATLDVNTDAGRSNLSAVNDQVRAVLDLASAMVEETGDVNAASAVLSTHRTRLVDVMVQSGMTREAAERYIAQLGLVPENIYTAVNIDTTKASAALAAMLTQAATLQSQLGGSLAGDQSGLRSSSGREEPREDRSGGRGRLSDSAPVVHVYVGGDEVERVVTAKQVRSGRGA